VPVYQAGLPSPGIGLRMSGPIAGKQVPA
jgi:hypothetical protein